MDDAKIYNICLMRVRFQIANARRRMENAIPAAGRQILESYNTGDVADIIDILELYDLEEHTLKGVTEKLEDLSYTVSMLVREKLTFDFDKNGNLGLYLSVGERLGEEITEEDAALTAA